jgi:endonuclease IV
MEEKEKYHAELDARISKVDKTLHEIKTKIKNKKELPSHIRLHDTIRKYEKAKVKHENLKQSDGGMWKKLKGEVEGLFDEIDEDLRETLAYFA